MGISGCGNIYDKIWFEFIHTDDSECCVSRCHPCSVLCYTPVGPFISSEDGGEGESAIAVHCESRA